MTNFLLTWLSPFWGSLWVYSYIFNTWHRISRMYAADSHRDTRREDEVLQETSAAWSVGVDMGWPSGRLRTGATGAKDPTNSSWQQHVGNVLVSWENQNANSTGNSTIIFNGNSWGPIIWYHWTEAVDIIIITIFLWWWWLLLYIFFFANYSIAIICPCLSLQ